MNSILKSTKQLSPILRWFVDYAEEKFHQLYPKSTLAGVELMAQITTLLVGVLSILVCSLLGFSLFLKVQAGSLRSTGVCMALALFTCVFTKRGVEQLLTALGINDEQGALSLSIAGLCLWASAVLFWFEGDARGYH